MRQTHRGIDKENKFKLVSETERKRVSSQRKKCKSKKGWKEM